MRKLGAILAGGQSSRFGSDKGRAMLNGRALIDHVIDALELQCDAIVVCGRVWGDLLALDDRPQAGQGPLGGLCAALHHAAANGFDVVLTAGCDTLPVPIVPTDPARAVVVAGNWLFGSWPVTLSAALDAHLATSDDRSMRRWIALAGARQVALAADFHNLNTPDDFRHYAQTQGLAA